MTSGEYKELGDAAFWDGRWRDASTAYSRGLDSCTDPSERGTLLANRCMARLKAGGESAAAAALGDAREALRLRPRWAKAHLRLAQASIALAVTSVFSRSTDVRAYPCDSAHRICQLHASSRNSSPPAVPARLPAPACPPRSRWKPAAAWMPPWPATAVLQSWNPGWRQLSARRWPAWRGRPPASAAC